MASSKAATLLAFPQGESLLHLAQESQAPFRATATFRDLSQRDSFIQELAGGEDTIHSHAILELSDSRIHSLRDTVMERLADMLDAEGMVIHIIGLENTPLFEILEEEKGFFSQLEDEGASWFHEFPLSLIFWLDSYTTNRLKHEAPIVYEVIDYHFSFLEEGKPEEMGQQYLQVMEWGRGGKEDFEASLEVAQLLTERGMLTSALEHFQRLLAMDAPDSKKAEAFLAMGKAQERTGSLPEANLSYETALAMAADPLQVGQLNHRLGIILQAQGEIKGAIDKLELARQAWLEVSPPTLDIGKICQRLGYLWERKGDLNLSVEYYTLAGKNWEECEPSDASPQAHIWQQVGAVRQNQQRYREALDAFSKALEFARQTNDEFLVHALEDSVENMEELVRDEKPRGSRKKKKKGLFGFLG